MLRFRARGLDGLQEAVRLGQQSFAGHYEIRLVGMGNLGPKQLNRFVTRTIDDGSFPLFQLNTFEVHGSIRAWTGTALVHVTNRFLCTPQQANGALSLAAEAALQLRPGLGRSPDTRTVIRVFQEYVNRRFCYHDGGAHSHQMGSLFRDGGGVCQAIASLAVAVMGFLGIPCRYVKGQGWSGTDWGGHAWNQFADGTMADFTFGMNGVTPNTLTLLGAQSFCRNHRWESCAEPQYTPFAPGMQLQNDSSTLRAGRVLVTTDNPPLSGRGLDLSILAMEGACAEYFPGQDAIRLALPGGGRQWLLTEASRNLRGRYMALEALPWRPGPGGDLVI